MKRTSDSYQIARQPSPVPSQTTGPLYLNHQDWQQMVRVGTSVVLHTGWKRRGVPFPPASHASSAPTPPPTPNPLPTHSHHPRLTATPQLGRLCWDVATNLSPCTVTCCVLARSCVCARGRARVMFCCFPGHF